MIHTAPPFFRFSMHMIHSLYPPVLYRSVFFPENTKRALSKRSFIHGCRDDSAADLFSAFFRQLLSVILQGIELIISALLFQQTLMGTFFHNLSMGEQNDVIRMLNGG